MTPAYALFRRSRSHQDLSIEEQREAVRGWATAHDYQIVREFADDGSGLDTDRRRDFLTLLNVCGDRRRREADTVLCYDVSRFSRLEPDEAAFHEYSLRRAGVQVLYTHEAGANETGVAGQLIKSLKRVMAHDYSQKLSQVVSRGLRAHAALGHWTGGAPPFGYRRGVRQADGSVRLLTPGRWKAKGETVSLIVDAGEARVVRDDIYEAYVHRAFGIATIAHRLNALGVPAPASLRRRGASAWGKGTIWAILRNAIYVGTLVYAKSRYSEVGKKRGKVRRSEEDRVVVEGVVPAIVPRELWAAAQARHGTRKFGVGRPWHRPYLLSGLIECAHCHKRGHAHRQVRGLVQSHYVCGGYVASGRGVCEGFRIATAFLDDAVIDGIQKRIDLVLDPEELRWRLRGMLSQEPEPADAVPQLQTHLVEARRKIERLVEALTAGSEPMPSVRAALVGLERERERLERDLAAAQARDVTSPGGIEEIVDGLVSALAKLRDVLEAGEPEERKAVVRTFLRGITVDKKANHATLTWFRLPVPQNVGLKLVELRGVEPLTPRLPALCSPN